MMTQAHPATQEEEQRGQMKQSSDPSLTVAWKAGFWALASWETQ